MESIKYQLYDVAANLTDGQFEGKVYGKNSFENDREEVVQRAKNVGCTHLLIAAGNLEDVKHSYELCKNI